MSAGPLLPGSLHAALWEARALPCQTCLSLRPSRDGAGRGAAFVAHGCAPGSLLNVGIPGERPRVVTDPEHGQSPRKTPCSLLSCCAQCVVPFSWGVGVCGSLRGLIVDQWPHVCVGVGSPFSVLLRATETEEAGGGRVPVPGPWRSQIRLDTELGDGSEEGKGVGQWARKLLGPCVFQGSRQGFAGT